MKIETKVVPVVQTKVLDESKGIVGAFVSVTGVVDSVADRILPGAYQKTLVARTPKGCWCVDEDTEILTTRGWLRYDEVTTEDEAYILDTEKMVSRFEPVQAVNVFEAKPRPMRHVQVGGFSSLSTMEHRWPVRLRQSGGGYKVGWKTTPELATTMGIFRALPNDDAPAEPKYSDAFVEVVAWFWNEGSVDYQKAGTLRHSITQSVTKNPVNCGRIRSALNRAFPSGWFENTPRPNGAGCFRMLKAPSEAVAAVCGQDKAPTPEFLMSLTLAQLHLFIDTCIDGDGTVDPIGATRWIQRSQHSLRMFEMACALAGIPTNTRLKPDAPGHLGRPVSTVTLLKRRVAKPFDALYMQRYRTNTRIEETCDEVVEHEGIVWCPTTPSGTWLARRNGSVYFTGNSHSWSDPVARTLEAEELLPGDDRLPKETRTGEPWPTGAGALYVEMQFNLGTTRGKDAFSDVVFYGQDAEWSIGYSVPPGGSKVDKKTGVREITYMDLYEYSPVLFGAMDLTQTAGVKDAQEAWKAKAEAGEVKEGQVFQSDRDPDETTPDQPVSDPEPAVVTPDKPTTLTLTGGNTVTYAGGTILPQVAYTSTSGTVTFVPDAPVTYEPKQAEFVVSWTEAGQAAVDAVSAWAVEESTKEGADLASILTEAGKKTDALLSDKANVSITSLDTKASVTLTGSYEERQSALRDALPSFLDDNFEDVDVNARDEWGYQATWVTIEATFNARVVAVVYDFTEDGGEPRYFDCSYAWDPATSEATVRAGREVVIQGVVVPKSAAIAAQVKAFLQAARFASAGVPLVVTQDVDPEPTPEPEAKSKDPTGLTDADLLMLERFKLDA